ncbi:MAG: deoxynucleoside kinase [Ruminococcus sp.]|nr:deoxynucleoside kinase [Ruminococcus sp.]MCM1479315.1 deoxynucleoside kinase [Muribaculaceae bacterium]
MGKLIVIDGLDGSGKTTQFEIIREKLSAEYSINGVKAISFPDYGNPSSALVKMYLSGELSKSADGVNAYAASSFYAVDRYASYKMFWEENYRNGDLILASRYVSSNAIHQMVKLPESHWDGYLDWLSDYEYGKLGLPKPDLVVFLDMPVEISQRLMSERYGGDESKKDIHEGNVKYLQACRKSALYAAERLGWKILECGRDGKPLSVEEINGKLLQLINEVL